MSINEKWILKELTLLIKFVLWQLISINDKWILKKINSFKISFMTTYFNKWKMNIKKINFVLKLYVS